MKPLALVLLLFVTVPPVLAQAPDPAAPPSEDAPKPSFGQRVFVGGGVAAGFGTVDFVALSPLVGFHVVPRLDLGVQPFYRWTRDGRYSPSVSTTDYGGAVFARVHIIKGLFGEADYEYSNYEYYTGGVSARDTHNA
jgi:hypothetical protein